MTGTPRYSLSTAWNYRNHRDVGGMVEEIKSLGFDSVELNFALTESQVNDFIKLKDSGYIRVSSTHNYCPLPEGVDPKEASPEYYSLTSRNKDERELAVRFTKKSMDFARRLGARALIVHLGRVDIEDRTKRLFTITDKARFEREKGEALNERREKAGPFLEAGMKSLEALLDHAGRIDLNIALETRYYIKEIPSLSEFKTIFNALGDRRLCYWHDTGHAQIYENLSILKHEDYLDALSNRLIGVHLHDIILFDDHRAPGCGEFDFGRLKPYLKPDTERVIEAHRISGPEEVKNSRKFLDKVLG